MPVLPGQAGRPATVVLAPREHLCLCGSCNSRLVARREEGRGDLADEVAVLGDHGDRGFRDDGAADEGHGGQGRLAGAHREEVGAHEAEGGHGARGDMVEEADGVEEVAHEVLLCEPAEVAGGGGAAAELLLAAASAERDGEHLRSAQDRIKGLQDTAKKEKPHWSAQND